MMATLLTLEALEADKYFVERELAQADSDPWGTARILWHNRLVAIQRQIAEVGTKRSNYASVALVFDGNPVIGTSNIRVDFSTDALMSYQKLVSARLAEKERDAAGKDASLPNRWRLPGARNTILFIRDLVRGSMGFILEELPEQAEFLPTRLKDAVESTTELLGKLSKASDDEFQQTVSETEPRVVRAIQKFTEILFEAGASTRISGDEQRLSLSIGDVDRLSKRLKEVVISEEMETIDGVLQGLLPEKLEFEFKKSGENGVTLRGDVADDLARKYSLDPAFVENLLHKPGRARIKVIRTIRNSTMVKELRIMESLEPRPS